jgi:hypothetical protein
MGGFKFATARPFKDFVTEDNSYIRIGDGFGPTFGIPLVFLVHFLESPPYDLYLDIDDETRSLTRMVLETVHVDYDDGDNRKFKLDLDKDFVPSKLSVFQDGELIKIPVMRLDEKLPAIVEKNKSCTIKLIGFFVDSAGNKIPFQTEDYFEYKPTYWRIYTGARAF